MILRILCSDHVFFSAFWLLPPDGKHARAIQTAGFADVDAKLKAMEAKTTAELARLQSGSDEPSSFVEEGAPDSFADLDAKLKVRSRGIRGADGDCSHSGGMRNLFVDAATGT